jgi:RNA methyltransferase, TrmH family
MLVKSQLKYIQSLGQKKSRDEAGVFIAEGPKIVHELINDIPGQVKQVYAAGEWITSNPSLPPTIEVVEVTDDELKKISQLTTPNQVLAIAARFATPAHLDTSGRITLALDTIQDPGNLGTIIRIADWFGVTQIVCSRDCADIYNPKVVQATMGSITRLQVLYTDLAEWLRSQAVRIYAASLEGQDVKTMNMLDEGIIVIGNESKGISEEIMALVNVRITIARKGRAESLNAGVATGVILSHLC